VLTDPDFAGESIRKIINTAFPGAKNAFISRSDGTKGDDIGVENADPSVILEALKKAKYHVINNNLELFDVHLLMDHGLTGQIGSKELRAKIGKQLGIGYANTRQFLSRLNRYGIEMETFLNAIQEEADSEE
jgi:ribonuclease M5